TVSDHSLRPDALEADVKGRLGVMPNFFRSAAAAPEIAQHLWAFAGAGYLDNPLPSLLKERLFVHLSRFCSVRYCIVRHSGFLLGRGRPAGDPTAQPHTIGQVAALLRRKGRLEGAELDAALARLEALGEPCLPEPESGLEADVFAAASEVFIDPLRAEASRRALHAALGPRDLEFLLAYLAFVRTAHYWTLTHPELAPEEDVETLLRDHEELAQLLMDDPEAARCDISARLFAELKELRAARSEYERIDRGAQVLRLALDATDQGTWDYDVAADRGLWDDKAYALFGAAPDADLSYVSIVFGMIHPEDRDPVDAATRAALDPAGDGVFSIEHRVVHPDGRTRWLSHRGRTLFEGEGRERRAVRMLGTVRDVTDDHHAAEALVREREALQAIFDSIPVMITLYDPQVNLLLLNREFERLTGWSTDNTEGLTIMEACYPDPDYRETVRAFMDAVSGWMDIRMRTHDGRFIETSWANVRLADDRRVGIGIDVSVRKEAERALAASEQRLRLASEAAGFGVYDFDVETMRSVWSPQLRRILGREGDNGTVPFEDVLRLIHPDDRAEIAARMHAAVREPGHYEFEFRVIRGDGAVRWVLDRGETFAGDDAGQTRARRGAGTLIDITDRKLVEQQLRQSEGRFREMADNLPLIVWMHDADGKLEFVNQTYCDYFGLAREDMHTDRWRVLVHPDDAPGYVTEFLACVRDRRPFHAECRVRRADGMWRWTEAWGRLRLDHTGAFLGHLGTSADITERKEAEARLRESEQRFRGIYENAGTGIAIAGLDGRFQSCNPAYAAMLGYSEDELRTMVSFELIHPDDREENLVEIRRLLAGEVPSFEILNRYVGKDGAAIWVHKHVSMLRDASGRFTHLIALVTDMTERKRAEEHRQLLVNELNHRVKNTLAVVQAIAQQTFRTAEAPDGLVASFQNRLAALAAAHNLLSRLNWQQASLEELARETTAASFVEAARIRMAGPAVVLPPKKAVTLAMALHELCTNAMKYGALSVPAGRVELSWEAVNGERPAIRLLWHESGGPPVVAPEHKGFGSRIIEQALAHEFEGRVDMDFRREGLVVILEGALAPPSGQGG
ncbi:MAG: PAS domain S-box protein, partial [Rhodospirillales bacterium]|nr:PAS domain S-box protein [Rhodospirillales bacterium]